MRPTELGLPTDDLTGYRLLYNAHTESVVVHALVPRDDCHWGRVYARGSLDDVYRVLAEPVEGESDTELVSSEGPYVAFLRSTGRRRTSGWAFGTPRLVRADLKTGAHETFELDALNSQSQWLSQLQWLAPDGRALIGVVATETADHRVEYSISRVEVPSGASTSLMPLRAVFV